MKMEVDSVARLEEWLANPVSAVFQGQDLEALSDRIATLPLTGCVFFGCDMAPVLIEAAAEAKCIVIPPRRELEFDAFTPGLYTPDELYNKFDPTDPENSYQASLDYLIYNSVTVLEGAPPVREQREVDVDITLMRRIHDWSISDALDDLLKDIKHEKCVAIMGGHDEKRNTATYADTALLALTLAQAGYVIVTGGGPGLMEAANMGAYAAGFNNPEELIRNAIASFPEDALEYKPVPKWVKAGYLAWKGMGEPQDRLKSRNIGIPTWFYGHEPPNLFATHIAKYFENSVREEGLLAIARAGIIFADGNGGTVQEMFQDANQNYYRTYGKAKSPMVLFDASYWHSPAAKFDYPKKAKSKPAYALLHKLATEKAFDDYILLTGDPVEVVDFIKSHPPVN